MQCFSSVVHYYIHIYILTTLIKILAFTTWQSRLRVRTIIGYVLFDNIVLSCWVFITYLHNGRVKLGHTHREKDFYVWNTQREIRTDCFYVFTTNYLYALLCSVTLATQIIIPTYVGHTYFVSKYVYYLIFTLLFVTTQPTLAQPS